jgi:membrane protein implicated in regulation of membrane protease activity
MNRTERARRLQPIPDWQRLPWWRKASICCGQPTFVYSLLFALVGGGFLLIAPLLDPDLAIVGLILVAVAVVMLLTFWLLAFRAFARERRRSGGPKPRRKGRRTSRARGPGGPWMT